MLRPLYRFVSNWVPLSVYERLIPRDVVGFCYHMVTDGYPAHTVHLGPHKTRAQFEADLQWLKSHYRLISYNQLCERRNSSGSSASLPADAQRGLARGVRNPGGEGASRNCGSTGDHGRQASVSSRFFSSSTLRNSSYRPAAVLTFDDGLREHRTCVAPLLQKYELPAVFFITTGFLDNKCLFYRHKASLCIEAARHRSESELARILVELAKCGEQVSPSGTGSVESGGRGPRMAHRSSAFRASSTSRILSWQALASRLLSFSNADESVIDAACRMLNVDCSRFLREQRPYMTTEELKQLQAAGFTIGAHSVTHARLDSRMDFNQSESAENHQDGAAPLEPYETLAPYEREIVDSCQTLTQVTAASSVPFAFPFSGDRVERSHLRRLRDTYPTVGLLFDRRGFQLDANFIVNRIIADDGRPSLHHRTSLRHLTRNAYRQQIRRAKVLDDAVPCGSR